MWNYRVIADNETGEGTTKEIKRAEGSKLTSPDFFLYEKWSPWKSSGRPLYVVIFNDRKSLLKSSILNTKLSTRFADMRPCGLAYARCGKRILAPFSRFLPVRKMVSLKSSGRPLYVVIFNDRKSRLKFSILNTKLSTRFADMRPCGLAYARCSARFESTIRFQSRICQVCPAPQGRGDQLRKRTALHSAFL